VWKIFIFIFMFVLTKTARLLYLLFLGTYFNALEKYGITAVVSNFQKEKQFKKNVIFLGTHLMVFTLINNLRLFIDLTQILFTFSKEDLAPIMHFKPIQNLSMFRKTAFTSALEDKNHLMVTQLLNLERRIHDTKEEGLLCLRTSVKNEALLLPWKDAFGDLYDKEWYIRWPSALWTVTKDLLLLAFLPYVLDVYSDIIMVNDFSGFAFRNVTFTGNEMLTSSGSQLNSCIKNITHDMSDQVHEADRFQFVVSYWVTLTAVILSFMFYVCSTVFNYEPIVVNLVLDRFYNERNWNESLKRLVGLCLGVCLALPIALLWPFWHIYCSLKCKASGELMDQVTKSTKVWNNIMAVEHGFESGPQLLLQLWLLGPFLLTIADWSYTDLALSCVAGIVNFITFNSFPARYVDKALGKICIAVFSLCLGEATMRTKKPGLDANLVNAIPIFVSILVQTVARIYAVTSLILFVHSGGYSKYAILLFLHCCIVFLIKIFCETSIKAKPLPTISYIKGMGKKKFKWSSFWSLFKFIISVLSSTIVMIHLDEEDRLLTKMDQPSAVKGQPAGVKGQPDAVEDPRPAEEDPLFIGEGQAASQEDDPAIEEGWLVEGRAQLTRRSRLFSHALFFLLMLVENLVLVLLPYLLPHYYPPLDCYTAGSRLHAVIVVAILWFVGRVYFFKAKTDIL
jgi:hypothetical protein